MHGMRVETPSVSVVIPAYNAAGYIREALDSVDAQTWADYEVIVVDDASADNTVEVVEEWISARSERVSGRYRLVRLTENLGPAGARNRAVAEACGEWIAFLDGDDIWYPHRLARQREVLDVEPAADMLCAAADRFSDKPPLSPQKRTGLPATGVLSLVTFVGNNPVVTSTVLLRKEVFESVGGFDPAFRGPEDMDLWLRVAARHNVVMMNESLAAYRSMAGSLSLDERRFLPEVLRVLDKAFASGGALSAHPEWRKAAVSTQYWNASWMAFCRGDRMGAVRLWVLAFCIDMVSGMRADRPWVRLLARYVCGRRP